ncbi:MAG TPA: hypothetical protein RMH99_19750, partial [Sandaracinaceae bacterium LLY-WYZ-13_1]|nr:hypothetical protein [Sandaracinaceae bacterium LLY-WYZ-13_1]
GPVDLVALAPASAITVLRADLNAVRRDPARYDRIAGQLATELGLASDAATLRALLDRTDEALGVFVPGAGANEGMLVFSGRYADDDFERALAIAAARHGSTPPPQAGAGGREIYALGDATLVKLDEWTWAVAQGPTLRAHLSQVPLNGSRAFAQDLLEFGARIGLPAGSAQAWADQDTEAGVDMVGLVFAGENPQMVANFVRTVQRHLGL